MTRSPAASRGARVAVIGAALADVRARTAAGWQPGRSQPGRVRLLPGGAGRNVATDLARLGYQTILLSAVGQDPLGEWVLQQTAEAGVDVTRVVRPATATGVFVCVGPEGGESWCISDASAVEALAPADLEAWRDVVDGASVVVADANLSGEMLQAVSAMAARKPLGLLAASPDKAVRLRGALAGAALVVCNREEALSLTGLPPTLSWQALGTALLTEGVAWAVITQGQGGVGIATAEGTAAAPARDVPVVDPTGAGDAVAAAAVHALRAGLSPEEAAALAAGLASVVVQSWENTPRELSTVLA
jgi:pseudouridine kinase